MFEIHRDTELTEDDVLSLYRACAWSAADKPGALMAALRGSHCVLTAWDGQRLIGLGNAISDGALVVYFPHLLVLPEEQGKGVGAALMKAMSEIYRGFHQQVLLSVDNAEPFYRKMGFAPATGVSPLWIYQGGDL